MKTRKTTSRKILIVVAMDTELSPLLKAVSNIRKFTIFKTFPLYEALYGKLKLFIVQTFVGDVNASIAGFSAIQRVNPDYVLKFGAVGGSYPESKAGDIIVPLGFFHRTAWITRNHKTNTPTSDASLWQSVFGKLPYQVSTNNLGGLPYFFPVSKNLLNACESSLKKLKMNYITAYVGGGNMWMFSQEVLDNVAATKLPQSTHHKRFVSDMESYALAHASYVANKQFIGCYVVASNDYLDEKYRPELVSQQMTLLVPYALNLSSQLADGE